MPAIGSEGLPGTDGPAKIFQSGVGATLTKDSKRNNGKFWRKEKLSVCALVFTICVLIQHVNTLTLYL